MKTLYLLRHAKAEPGSPSFRDEDRPLAPRGREACKSIREYMKHKRYLPDLVLCSTATRTRETLERVQDIFPETTEYVWEKKLYLATPGEMLAHVHAIDLRHETALLVGHNPGMHHLAALLASGDATPQRMELEIKYPTGALAVIRFSVKDWTAIMPDSGGIMDFVTPKGLEDA